MIDTSYLFPLFRMRTLGTVLLLSLLAYALLPLLALLSYAGGWIAFLTCWSVIIGGWLTFVGAAFAVLDNSSNDEDRGCGCSIVIVFLVLQYNFQLTPVWVNA
ncbi:MAG: hypothetical protein MI861_12575, partial [Pirellulales bacterium]|nr:hypothetical protein [Pirellulales bacterium]